MAEEEVNDVSVVFKTIKRSPPKAKEEEEPVYDNEVMVRSKTTENTADTDVSAGLLPDKRTDSRGRCYQQVAYCLGILHVILLLGFISVRVYISTINNESEKQLKENQTTLLALNHNLTNMNNKLSSENENLRRDNDNLTVRFDNLTQACTVLESNIKNLTVENQNLTSQNTKLSAEKESLKSQNTKLSENLKITLETQRTVELNVIDTFCPKAPNQNRQCKACQAGWLHFQSSCYAINDPAGSGQKTWEEARENCRGKISDLAVIVHKKEKTFINEKSWTSSGTNGYWIGLKAENGIWKWVDGNNLTDNSWIQEPATNGQCVISVQTEGWKSVSCGDRNRWICRKKALSV